MTRNANAFLFRSFIGLVMLAMMTLSAPQAGAQVCNLLGMADAAITDDPGFEGLWKYTITYTWEAGKGLSHTDVFLGLVACECVCEEGLIVFADPAGSSTGELPSGEECTVDYVGEYLCMGDPTIPDGMNSPAVKFDAVTGEDGCEPAATGVGFACFYSPLPPGPINSVNDGLAIKAGQEICFGPINGRLPLCDCSVPSETSTWGKVKGIFR